MTSKMESAPGEMLEVTNSTGLAVKLQLPLIQDHTKIIPLAKVGAT